MSDENINDQSNSDPGQSGANTGVTETPTVPSSATLADDLLKDAKSKGFSHGYKKARKELLESLGVDSVETLKATIETQRQAEQEKEAKALADREEKETLAKQLQENGKRIKSLEAESEKLHTLRSQVKREKVKVLGLKAGIRESAIDLVMHEVDKAVQWNEDFTALVVKSGDEEIDFDQLFKKIRESHPYVFESHSKRGAGISPNSKRTGSGDYKPSYSPMSDRIKGF